MSDYFDFDNVEVVAAEIAKQGGASSQEPRDRFQHYSGGVKVRPTEFRAYMEKFYQREFREVELDEWIAEVLKLGIEELIVVYLREVMESGRQIVFPFMGAHVED